MHIQIRRALPEEMAWVNGQYEKVQFQPSKYEQEIILIAEVGGAKAGLGRLVRVNEQVLELGGMYVADAYRGMGLARKLVGELATQAQNKTLYCLPFEHLQGFYMSCGFVPVQEIDAVPEKVREKWVWCNRTYAQRTLLLVQKV
ncbi:MAG: GNAT family N-acetyltransferase [Hymenobacteraceae bacterium]|nr:GNAT family N-acetyltransferase [Hymenobacteraceae bacterium]MDX5481550.1 GNAT family N-acetyltransferase [Hymenobacteraceae bacterium]